VFIAEWEVEVEVKSMTAGERSKLLKTASDDKGNMNFEKLYTDIIIMTVYDPETHEKVFTEADRDIINTKNSACIEQLSKVALELSGLSGTATAKIEGN